MISMFRQLLRTFCILFLNCVSSLATLFVFSLKMFFVMMRNFPAIAFECLFGEASAKIKVMTEGSLNQIKHVGLIWYHNI